MNKRGKIMGCRAIILPIGIIIIIVGYNKYLSMAETSSTIANSTPPGAIETTIGILVAAIGMFVAIYGFGQLEENRKVH